MIYKIFLVLLLCQSVMAKQLVHYLSDYWVGQPLGRQTIVGLFYEDRDATRVYKLILDNSDVVPMVFNRVSEPTRSTNVANTVESDPVFEANTMIAEAQAMLMQSIQMDNTSDASYFNPSSLMAVPNSTYDLTTTLAQQPQPGVNQANLQTPVDPVVVQYEDSNVEMTGRVRYIEIDSKPLIFLDNGSVISPSITN